MALILQIQLYFDLQNGNVLYTEMKYVQRQLSCPVRDNYDGRLIVVS